MALPLEQFSPMLFGAVALALAGLLLALNFEHRATRAFALLLALRGMVPVTYGLGLLAPSPAAAEFWWRVFPYFAMPLALAALAFLAVYPNRRAWAPRALPGLPFLLAGAAFAALYAADHRLFWDLGARSGDLRGPMLDARAGPLFALDAVFELAYAAVAAVLARDAVRSAPGPQRRATLLVSLGFALVVLFDGLSILAFTPDFVWRHTPALSWAIGLSLVLAVALVAASAAWLAAVRARTADADLRRALHRYLLALPLPVASVLVLFLVPADPPRLLAGLVYILSAVWRLALPVLVGVALVRHRIFDIDLKLRWAVRQSTVAGAFVAMFFVVSETAALVFSQWLGTFVGIVAAGALLLVLAPLQRVGERVARAAVPGAKPLDDLNREERAAMYREQSELAWADGVLTRKERLMLETLRQRLALSPEEATRLELEVTGG